MSGSVSVTGGTHGVEVQQHQLTKLAGDFGNAGLDSVATSAALHAYLVDGEITLSALFDPAGYAAFQAALEAALDGPFGLTWIGARCGVADAMLRGAIVTYDLTEKAVESLADNLEVTAALGYFLVEEARTRNTSLSIQRAITRFPGAADALVDDLGLVDVVRGTAALGAATDGHGAAVRTGTDSARADAAPPRSLSDVIGSLGQRDDDPHHGAVDVRILTRSDGSRSVIVDVTGTKSWTPLPTSDVTSLITNARAMVGDRTSYEAGVLKAMQDAGVTKTDDVMIVGHSQGGLVAVTTARDAVRERRFNITHVITAGSPIGLTAGSLPGSVKVLALENQADIVPHLDGTANPARENVTTVSGRFGNGAVGDDHGTVDGYGPLARAAQASSDASIRDYLDSCKGFFDAQTATTTTYQVVRKY